MQHAGSGVLTELSLVCIYKAPITIISEHITYLLCIHQCNTPGES